MSDGPGTAREAAQRNAEAIATGNLNQVLADITPEVIQKLMQMGAQMSAQLGVQPGAINASSMPSIEHYSVEPAGTSGDDERFETTFTSADGSATVASTWRLIGEQWKIVDVEVLRLERTGEANGKPNP
jgi:hypothetical protein